MKYINHLLLLFLSAGLFMTSCVDNTIDEPPVKEYPAPEVNASVEDVLDLWIPGQFVEIPDNMVFDAIVVGDDETGNFYKSIVVQDETGGITIRIEANNIYTVLPVGRKVYVQASGLYISDYNGLPQIGYEENDGELLTIPFNFISDDLETAILVPGERNQDVTPSTLAINTLGTSALNTLIKLEDVQFASSELGQTYADAENQLTENRTLEDCDGNQVVVRTSGYASFASVPLPDGKGDLTCVYTIFGDTKQLTVVTLDDVNLDGERCGEVVIETPEPNATIADVMALYQAGSVTEITDDLIFDAVVVADDKSGNFYKQIVVQDETGGVNIQVDAFDLFENYEIGRRIVLKVKGLAVGDYNGLPQIGFESGGEISRIPESTYKNHLFKGNTSSENYLQSVSINELDESYYNTLIELSDVEFASSSLGDTYADAANQFSLNHDVVDCDGNSIILRSSGYADFADVKLAEGNGTLVAIMSVFGDTKQLVIRKIQDVNMSGTRCDGGGGGGDEPLEEMNEDFEGLAADVDVDLEGWTNEVTKGVRLWRTKEFNDNVYVQATAYQDTESEMETWLITPELKMNGSNTLSFQSAVAYYTHNGLSVLISSDYKGDASNATWTELNADFAGSSESNYDWVESGSIDLSSFSGNVHIGFRYQGNGASNTATFIIDNVVMTK